MERNLQNIIIQESAAHFTYSPVNQRGGDSHFPTRASRSDHAAYLIKQLDDAWEISVNEGRGVVATPVRKGVYLQIEGKEGYELITKSLENISQHVRLLNVCKENDTCKATVYVPQNKKNFFLKKINKYAESETKKDVVATIEKINAAMVETLWVGKKESMPGKERQWCEIWLRYEVQEGSQRVLHNFKKICEQLNVEIKNDELIFPERVVVLVYANQSDLKNIMLSSDNLAEIRKMVSPIGFFVGLENYEQREWAKELSDRIDISRQSDTSICLLDTGVNNAHPLLQSVLKDSDMHMVDSAMGVDDRNGHGTEMAGIATYFDLQEKLEGMSTVEIYHYLESVKILNHPKDNAPELYGAITQQAAYLAEIENPGANRTFCMAITSHELDEIECGAPSSWSAAVDALLVGAIEGEPNHRKRLMCISAGNTTLQEIAEVGDYFSAIELHSVEDPGQAWNAITVGAYTEKIIIEDDRYNGCLPVAQQGGVSPFNSSSVMWEKSKWPVKPDVVFEGGNLGYNSDETFLGGYTEIEDLDLLTTCKDFVAGKSFIPINMTSPATAQAAWMLANIEHNYPDIWPETVRALLIHSANWTEKMIETYIPDKCVHKNDYRNLVRVCGYGVPDLERAIHSAQNSVNLIIEDELQPFKKKANGSSVTMNEMHMHNLPWPQDILSELGESTVRMKVTLSYYIEPGPGQIGWKDKYRYPSCGLLFDVNNPTESEDQFKKRISRAMRDENENPSLVPNANNKWLIGPNNRNTGSIHSDIWEGTAAELSQSSHIMVYPTTGWWKVRTNLKRFNSKVRYALIVSIETPENEVNLYSEIATKIQNKTVVETTIGSERR